MSSSKYLIPVERIQQKILLIRGKKVMLDREIAMFYQVATSNLNKAVARNIERFPEDFMFQLSLDEFKELKNHFPTAGRGGSRSLPFAFTEQGVAMLSAVLRSDRAVAVSIQIVRSFMELRKMILSNETLARKVKVLEDQTNEHTKAIVQIINELQSASISPKKKIGF